MPKETNRDTSTKQSDMRSYDDIRRLIRHAYLYGTYSDSDYVNEGYTKTKLRQLAYLWSSIATYFDTNKVNGNVLTKNKIPGRKKNKYARRIFIDSFLMDGSFIASTYKHFSITKNDLLYYLYFLCCFGSGDDGNLNMDSDLSNVVLGISSDKWFGREDFFDCMNSLWNHNQIEINKTEEKEETPFSRTTLNSFLEEMFKQGMLHKRVSNSKIEYILEGDVLNLEFLSIDSIGEKVNSLLFLVRFFQCAMPFAVPGYFIEDKLLTIACTMPERKKKEITQNIFHFSKTNYHNIVDDGMMWLLMEKINDKCPIVYFYHSNSKKENEYKVLPMKIIIDNIYGRHYLFGYGYSQKSYVFHRIDCIENVSDYDTCSILLPAALRAYGRKELCDISEITELFCKKHLSNSWNVEPCNKGVLYPVKIIFDFSKCSRGVGHYLKRKVINNPIGQECVEALDDNHMSLYVKISSVNEIIPWLHSFSGYAVVDRKVNIKLYEIMKTQAKELAELYGIV